MDDTRIPLQTCWGCSRFGVDFDWGYSEFTPGSGFTISCQKDHFYLDEHMSEKAFAAAMQQGFICPDFKKKT